MRTVCVTVLLLTALLPAAVLAKGGKDQVSQGKVTKGAPAKGPSEKTFSQTLGGKTSALGTPDDPKVAMEGAATRKVAAVSQAQAQAKADKVCLDRIWNLVHGDSNVVRKVDGDGRTFLHHAAFNGYPRTVKFLLERGSDPKARDLGGATPAELALRGGYPNVAGQINQFKP